MSPDTYLGSRQRLTPAHQSIKSAYKNMPGFAATAANEALFGLGKKVPGVKRSVEALAEHNPLLALLGTGAGIAASAGVTGALGQGLKGASLIKALSKFADKHRILTAAAKGLGYGGADRIGHKIGEGEKVSGKDALRASDALFGVGGHTVAKSLAALSKVPQTDRFLKNFSKKALTSKQGNLLERANTKELRAIQSLMDKPQVEDAFERSRSRFQGKAQRNAIADINKISKTNPNKLIARVKSSGVNRANPLFEEFYRQNKTPDVKEFIKRQGASGGSYEFDKALAKAMSRTNESKLGLRTIDKAKRLLQGETAIEKNREVLRDKTIAAEAIRNALLGTEKGDIYRKALDTSERYQTVANAAQLGNKFRDKLPQSKRNAFEKIFSKASESHNKAMRAGAADRLRTDAADLISREGKKADVYGKILNRHTMNSLSPFTEGSTLDRLRESSDRMSQGTSNYNKLAKAKHIALEGDSKNVLPIIQALTRTTRFLGKTADKSINRISLLPAREQMAAALSNNVLSKALGLASSPKASMIRSAVSSAPGMASRLRNLMQEE